MRPGIWLAWAKGFFSCIRSASMSARRPRRRLPWPFFSTPTSIAVNEVMPTVTSPTAVSWILSASICSRRMLSTAM
jgi:hypothetical protein